MKEKHMPTKTLAKKKTPSDIRQKRQARVLEVLREYESVREQISDLQEKANEHKGEALDIMTALRQKSVSFEDHRGKKRKATRVQGSSISIDESGLAKKLGAKIWQRITTRVLDRRKLDAYIASGEISVDVVAAYTTEKQNAPYIKIT